MTSIIQDAVLSNDDPVSGLREIIANLLGFLDENMGFFKIMSSEQSHFEMHAEMASACNFMKRIKELESRNISMIADYIRSGIETGAFKQVNPEDAASVLLSAVRGVIVKQVIEPTDADLSEKAESIASILLDGLRKGDQVDMG